MDDSQPPNVSYASSMHSLSSGSDEEGVESEEEEDEGGGADPMVISQYMDWEHLDPSIEELRQFEEDQMRQALVSAKPSSTTTTSDPHRATVHAQEAEIYRQRLRRLDYNSTYMDYAALTSTGSIGGGGAGGDSFRSCSSSADNEDSLGRKTAAREGSPSVEASSSGGTQAVASGLFGTLSSLWTSTFGGSKS